MESELNDFNNPQIIPLDNSSNIVNDEIIKPYKLSYDGSNIISSYPIDNNSGANNNEIPNINNENKEQTPDTNTQDNKEATKENESYDIKEIIRQNQLLTEQINNYHRVFKQIINPVNAQNGTPSNIKSNKSELDTKLEETYNKAKQDAVAETLAQIERDKQFEKKVDELRKQNPDIAGDPKKEDLIGAMAAKYINTGMDFDTSVNKAISDFREMFSAYQNNPQTKEAGKTPITSVEKNLSPTVNNIPQNKPYKKTQPQVNPFIEGHSPSLPEKQFKASELIDMQINRPDEYLRLQPQIMQAYRDGLVIFD